MLPEHPCHAKQCRLMAKTSSPTATAAPASNAATAVNPATRRFVHRSAVARSAVNAAGNPTSRAKAVWAGKLGAPLSP
jgi:hypothetical protein